MGSLTQHDEVFDREYFNAILPAMTSVRVPSSKPLRQRRRRVRTGFLVIAVILALLWVGGFAVMRITNFFIHLLILFAAISLLFHFGFRTSRIGRFWSRVSNGLDLLQLWNQFHTDLRSSYRLYSRGVDPARAPGAGRIKHYVNLANRLFWAVVECLSPARRILLLFALGFFIADLWTHPGPRPPWFGAEFWAVLLLFCVLLLEVGDRVVMKRDLEIAKEIQAWLLPPSPPVIPGVEIAFITHPANTVAGDYYDVFSRSSSAGEESFLIAVADVAGKSIPAAMLMATFQASLKTLANSPGPLTELLDRMNAYACSNSQNGRRFTTAFIAEYAPASRIFTCVNAGHNPPMLRRQTGEYERLDVGGIPLGILAGSTYESKTITMQPGDWLVIFTDGVTEAENSSTDAYGERRLQDILDTHCSETPSTLLQTILSDLNFYCGNTPQQDDVTLLLVKAS